ncbi:MAG: response regulator, partial [Phycisphaerales bacterium]|nr:response regulator [Phycisphaerales bacterium]
MMRKTYDVLIVDDDQNMRLTLAEILADDGYGVLTASTGEEAVDICKKFTFRLVLMDVRMPGIDGIEAFRQIRKNCVRSQIVLMSAYSDPQLQNAAIDEGALAFMPKPVPIEAINKLIAEVTSTAVLYVGTADEFTRRVLQTISGQGFQTSVCEQLHNANQLLRQINYDVLILDVDNVSRAAEQELSKFLDSARNLSAILVSSAAFDDDRIMKSFESRILGRLRYPLESEAAIMLLESD